VAVKKMNLERVNMKLVRTPASLLAEQTAAPTDAAAALAGRQYQQQDSNRLDMWHWQLSVTLLWDCFCWGHCQCRPITGLAGPRLIAL
jgi:hypothetical protein